MAGPVSTFFRVLDVEMTSDKVVFCKMLGHMLYFHNLYHSSERARAALQLLQSTWRRRRLARTQMTKPDMYTAWGLVHKYIYDQTQEQQPTRPYTRTRNTIRVTADGTFKIQSCTHVVSGHRRRYYGYKKLHAAVHQTCKRAVLVNYHWRDTRKRKRS